MMRAELIEALRVLDAAELTATLREAKVAMKWITFDDEGRVVDEDVDDDEDVPAGLIDRAVLFSIGGGVIASLFRSADSSSWRGTVCTGTELRGGFFMEDLTVSMRMMEDRAMTLGYRVPWRAP